MCFSFQVIKPQTYKRETIGRSDCNILQRAMQFVLNGDSVRHVVRSLNVDRMTLQSYIDKRKDGSPGVTGNENCSCVNMIFIFHMETELARHIKQLAASYRGLSKEKCRALVFQYAVRNEVEIPKKWQVRKQAGEGFWLGFKTRINSGIRGPDATSLDRATAFNLLNVGQFFLQVAESL